MSAAPPHQRARIAPRGAPAVRTTAAMDLSAFNEYEREFLSLTSPLPSRVSAILQYTSDAEQATAEIKRVDSDLVSAKQRVRRRLDGAARRATCTLACPAAQARHVDVSTSSPPRLNDRQVEARGLAEPTRRELGNKVRLRRRASRPTASDGECRGDGGSCCVTRPCTVAPGPARAASYLRADQHVPHEPGERHRGPEQGEAEVPAERAARRRWRRGLRAAARL